METIRRCWSLFCILNKKGNFSKKNFFQLLLHLEESSSRLFEAFERTENSLRMIDRDLKFTGIRLENTINNFSMLSNKQFIENVSPTF